jgi:iron complex transport system substrate-binding protein
VRALSDRLLLFFLFVALVLVAAAGGAPRVVAAQPDAPAVRVATLLPFVEDALRLAPERAAVVATVRRRLHEPPAEGAADLGSPHAPSLEQIVAARPDLVVGDRTIHRALADDLGRGGAEVVLLDTGSIDATLGGLRDLARRLGAESSIGEAIDTTRRGISAHALATPIPTLVLFGTPGSFFVVTDRTWLGDLIEALRFENLAPEATGDERFPGLVGLNDEVLSTLRPELVLMVAHGDPKALEEQLRQRVAAGGPWAGVRRSATRGVHVLDPETFAANPGLGLDRAAAMLADLVAPPESAAR